MNETTIISILTLLLGGGTVGALITFWANRKKTTAETDNLVVEGATALLKPLTDRVTCLEADLEKERKRRKEVEESREKEIGVLSKELVTLKDELELEGRKRRELQDTVIDLDRVVMAKDKRIEELETKVAVLEAQLEALEQVPATRKKGTGPLKDSSV